MSTYEFIIIGSGIVGLTVARELMHRGHKNICLLEKEESLGVHSSGRNSGVVHAGIYYPPQTLKAKLCVSGAKANLMNVPNRNVHSTHIKP